MRSLEIKKGIYWVGVIDWDLREFHSYYTPRGSTYNAYLIIDEKITLVDTVKPAFYEEMLDRIKSIIDPAKIDYIISNHSEMDHSGSIPLLTKVAKNAIVVATPQGEKALDGQFHQKLNYQIVKTGDTLPIGKRTLEFIQTPMVHWPDSMVSYIPEEKLLFSNDGFGQHIASSQRYDDELGWDLAKEELCKYYANILQPFAGPVKKALEQIKKLDIDMIAPSHGVIWREYVKEVVEEYKKFAKPTLQNRAVIVFDTMWGSTKEMAHILRDVFEENNIPVELMSLEAFHRSDIITYILESKYLCVGSPTLNNGVLPNIAAFLSYLNELAPDKAHIGLAFGSYGWSGQSIPLIENSLKDCGFSLLPSIKAQYAMTKEDIEEIKKTINQALKG